MSQPAVSTQLARLRKIARDPLFVRTAGSMQPSALAVRWSDPVALALETLARALDRPAAAVDAHSQRTFVVYMTDVGQALLLHRLLARLEGTAPGVKLRVISAWDGGLADRLHDGSIDVAFGWIPQLKGHKSNSTLFMDHYVGVHDASSILAKDPLRWRYAMADIPGSAHQAVVQRFRVHALAPVVTAPNFFMLMGLLTGTSLVAVVPRRLVSQQNAPGAIALRLVELPVRLPAINIRVHWSTGTWRDEAVGWLRDEIVAVARALPSSSLR